MQAHIAGEVTSLAFCYRIECADGTIQGFTSWNEDFTFDGQLYKGNTVSAPTTIKSSIGTGVDNLELGGAVSSDLITEERLRTGRYDDAKLDVFVVSPLDLAMGMIVLFSGYVGDVQWTDSGFVAEARSLMQRTVQEVGIICMPTCRAELGDSACGVNLGGLTVGGDPIQVDGEVTDNISRRVFESDDLIDLPDGHFNVGKVHWLSGANEGLSMEVKTSLDGAVELQLEMPYDIEKGDHFRITAGCDGRPATCRDKFDNIVRFRGEPHIPGADATIRVVND